MRKLLKKLGREPESLSGKTFILSLANMVGMGANIVTPFVLVRIFTKQEYGLLGMIFFLITSVHSIVGLNVSNSAAYFIPRGELEPKRVLASIQGLNLALGVALFGVMLLAPQPILWLFKSESVGGYLFAIGLALFLWNGSRAMSLVPIALGKSVVSATYIAATESLRSVCVLLPGLIFGSVSAVLYGFLFWSLIRFLVVWRYLRVSVGIRARDFDVDTLRRLLRYCLPFGVTAIIITVFTKYHGFLVGHFADDEQFAVYRVGVLQSPLMMLVLESAIQILTPEIARLQNEGNRHEIMRLCLRASVKVAALFLPTFVFLFLMTEEFIIVCFTDAYLASSNIMRANLFEFLIVLLILDPVVRAYEELKYLRLRLYGAGLIALFLMGEWVITNWGAAGAVAMTLSVYFINKLVTLWRVAQTLGAAREDLKPLSDLRHIFRGCLAGGCLAAASKLWLPLALAGWSGRYPWLASFCVLAVAGVSFLGAYILFVEGGFRLHRLKELAGWVRR